MSENKNVATVRAIGAGERKLGETADEIVAANPDATREDATELVWAFVGGKDGAPAQMDRSKQKTDFGRGFGSLVSAVRNRLTVKGDTDWLQLVRQAAANAVIKGEFDPEVVIKTAVDHLNEMLAAAAELADAA